MPLDEQKTTLPRAFAQPAGQTDGPQVFEASFDNDLQAGQWALNAERVAESLDIDFEWQAVPGSEWRQIQFCVRGDEYQRLFDAMREDPFGENVTRSYLKDGDGYAEMMSAVLEAEYGS